VLKLETIARADVHHDPFQFFATGDVLSEGSLSAIRKDFPAIEKPGIFPLSALEYGPAFGALIDDIRSDELAEVVGHKLGVDLTGLPLMITVRGRAQAKDGRIHTDTKDKVVTCLLYLNERWDDGGGRLRMLRGPGLQGFGAVVPRAQAIRRGSALRDVQLGPIRRRARTPVGPAQVLGASQEADPVLLQGEMT
jgi:hypothetical protein